MKRLYQPIVIMSVGTRPMRSATTPASIPPKAETTSVTVATSPACPRLSAKDAAIAVSVKL